MLQGTNVQPERDRPRTRPASSETPAAESRGHAVQFYETDAFLVSMIARFAAAGLTRGEAVVVVATHAHSAALIDALRAKRIDVDEICRSRRLCLRDANELLAVIMDN